MLEFDPINNFHLHANMYHLYRTGTNLVPDEYTDLVTMSQGERGILEFKYKFPGQYMFHAHKTEFAEKGWMGSFLVKDSTLAAQDAGRNNIVGAIEANGTTTISGNTTPSIHFQNGSKSNLRVGGLEGN
jgi:hypothetical protein